MIECIKKMEIKSELETSARNSCNNVVRDLFVEIPTLRSVSFSKTNEYDDSNYSDLFSVISINQVKLYDGNYVDEEYEEVKDLPKEMPDRNYEVPFIVNVIESLSQDYDYGEDHVISREEVVGRSKYKATKNKAFDAYYIALKTGEKVEDISVFKNNPNWALYYSMDVLKSRLPREMESVFKKDIKYAYYYATKVIKSNLPEMIENHFFQREKSILLKTFDENENNFESWYDKEEKYYLAKYRDFVNEKNKK
jgi:hypothetical protein